MTAPVSVMDYRWLGEAHGQAVHQLQLLVRDDRLSPELEMDWINAGLAGRIWPAAVLEFYLDHVVVREGGAEEEKVTQSAGEDSMVRSIWEGEQQLREGNCIMRIVGTLGMGLDEWEKVWREMEILECTTLSLQGGGNNEESEVVGETYVNLEQSFEDGMQQLKRFEDVNGNEMVEGRSYTGHVLEGLDNLGATTVEGLLEELYIVSHEKDESEIVNMNGKSQAEEDVEENSGGDDVKSGEKDKPDKSKSEDVQGDSGDEDEEEDAFDDTDCGCDEYFKQTEQTVLLFEVVFKQDDGESVEAVLKLEDLKYWAPSLLLKFLQARLEVAAECDEDEEATLPDGC